MKKKKCFLDSSWEKVNSRASVPWRKKCFPSAPSAHWVSKAPLAVRSESMLRGPPHTKRKGHCPPVDAGSDFWHLRVRKKEEKKEQENCGILWKERILTRSMMIWNKDDFIWKKSPWDRAAMVLASIWALQRTCVLPLNPDTGKDGWVDNGSRKERCYQHDGRE